MEEKPRHRDPALISTAIAGNGVLSSGRVAQTFACTDLVKNSAYEMATWSPSAGERGGSTPAMRPLCLPIEDDLQTVFNHTYFD